VIRVDLGAQGLGRVRFAMSPLDTAMDLLFLLGHPRLLPPAWRARAVDALSGRRLGLLAIVTRGGPHGYVPDFPRPEPAGFVSDVDAVLHRVATAPPEQVRHELAQAVGGGSWDHTPAHRAPRLLLAAMERGEAYMAERIADELAQFWHAALAPQWPRIRARLEGDVNTRATAIAQHGIIDTVNHLAVNLRWDDGALTVHLSAANRHRLHFPAEAAFLVPSYFAPRAAYCAGDVPSSPVPRTPLIVYPACPDSSAEPAQEQLIGVTRTRILAELAQPLSTGDLAKRLYLSPSTISYHLQILHRAGRVQRTRHSHRVLYQRTPQ
jgi:DNA-binding transcriptional ArsR family regulator